MRLYRLTVLLTLFPWAVVLAESNQERQAREELERQLKAMVGTPPTKIRVEFVGLDQPNYDLVEATFNLDGRSLPVSNLKKLNSEGAHLIFHGDVQPGEHRLDAKFEFRNTASPVVAAEGGFKWKPGSEVSFRAERGIEVQIKVTPELNMSGDIKNRIKVKSPATVKMLAKLDDGTMPEPIERPKLVFAEAVDAGVAVAKGETANDKAAAAKQAADIEKKRLAGEARAARLAASAEKKRAVEDAKGARVAAAEEKKRVASEPVAAKDSTVAIEPPAVAVEPPVEVFDAGVAVVEIDAGPTLIALNPPAVQPSVADPVEDDAGLPLPVLLGIGVALMGVILFVISRRR